MQSPNSVKSFETKGSECLDCCVAMDQVGGPSEKACFHFSSSRLLLVQR